MTEVSGEMRERTRRQLASDLPNLWEGHFAEIKRVLEEEEPGYLQ